MTRIFVPRGSGSSSSNQNRPSPPSSQPQSQPSSTTPPSSSSSSVTRDEDQEKDSNLSENEIIEQSTEEKQEKNDDLLSENKPSNDESTNSSQLTEAISSIHLSDNPIRTGSSQPGIGSSQVIGSASYPPPPPVPPPNPSSQLNTTTNNSNLRRLGSGGGRIGSSRRSGTRGPQQPSSPRSISESDGYNSADEIGPCPKPSNYADAEREHMFEVELRRVKGFEIRRMLPDGNCLFRSVADQVYGDPEAYDVARHMCVDYMERERDHFSQFITEGFTSYCRRKRRDKVYGNNMEIQAFAEMYNRPIHIYSYSTEPINIFQGSYNTDTPPIRLSFHHGNHYNSLVDPRRLGVGVGLGFSTLRGVNADRDQVKAAIKAQQDHQIDNALIAEGRFYSDMELTEKEIERMVMEASRAEYLKQQQQQHSFTSGAEPSSSATIIGSSNASSGERVEENNNNNNNNNNSSNNKLTGNMRQLMAMGFSYVQVIEAHSIFGDDVDSMICYLLETGTSSGDNRRKGKAAE